MLLLFFIKKMETNAGQIFTWGLNDNLNLNSALLQVSIADRQVEMHAER